MKLTRKQKHQEKHSENREGDKDGKKEREREMERKMERSISVLKILLRKALWYPALRLLQSQNAVSSLTK